MPTTFISLFIFSYMSTSVYNNTLYVFIYDIPVHLSCFPFSFQFFASLSIHFSFFSDQIWVILIKSELYIYSPFSHLILKITHFSLVFVIIIHGTQGLYSFSLLTMFLRLNLPVSFNSIILAYVLLLHFEKVPHKI